MDNKMKTEEIAGIARALVAAAGGWLVGQGIVDSETMMTVGGAITTIVVAFWSIYSKRKAV